MYGLSHPVPPNSDLNSLQTAGGSLSSCSPPTLRQWPHGSSFVIKTKPKDLQLWYLAPSKLNWDQGAYAQLYRGCGVRKSHKVKKFLQYLRTIMRRCIFWLWENRG